MYRTVHCNQILMKFEFSRQIFEKYSNIKCQENPTSGSRDIPCGRTNGHPDMTKLMAAFAILRTRLRRAISSTVPLNKTGLHREVVSRRYK